MPVVHYVPAAVVNSCTNLAVSPYIMATVLACMVPVLSQCLKLMLLGISGTLQTFI
jgi:hypothetical protein